MLQRSLGLDSYTPSSSEESIHGGTDPQSSPQPPQPTLAIIHDFSFQRKSKSHARKQNQGHVPRPRNAFILFRCNFVKQRVPDDVISDHRDLSRLAGCMWRKMSDEQKQPWFEKAEVEKQCHLQMFPTYRYTPDRGSHPKRMYQRKKPPVPEEILLRDPQVAEPQPVLSPDDLGCSPVLQAPLPLVSNVCPCPNPQATTEGFRSTRAENQSCHSNSPSEKFRSFSVLEHEKLRPPSPGTFNDGFLQFPKRDRLLSSEHAPIDPSSYDPRAFWLPGTAEAHNPDPIYPYAASYSPIPTSAPTPSQGENPLYNMWRDLEFFHEQPLPPHSPDLTSNQYPYDDFSYFAASPSQETSYTPSSTSSVDEIYSAESYLVDVNTGRNQSPAHSP